MVHIGNTNKNNVSTVLLIFFLIPLFITNAVYGAEINTDLNDSGQKNGKGYKIAGICLSSVGSACIVTSIPLFVSAVQEAESHSMIDSNIRSVFGSCFLIGGLVLGSISIPFYIKHKKLNKETNVSFDFGPNTINMIYEF